MWAALLPLLAGLPGMLGKFFQQRNDIESARIETERQVEMAKQQLAMEIARGEVDRSKAALTSTGSYFKYFTFFMWFGPFMVGVFSPSTAKDIFLNLQGMPEWYVQSCMLIMFTVWGISVSAPVVSNIFTGLGSFMANRRDYKLEKARINRKAYYDAIRKLTGSVSEAEVKAMEPVFDQMDKENENGQ